MNADTVVNSGSEVGTTADQDPQGRSVWGVLSADSAIYRIPGRGTVIT